MQEEVTQKTVTFCIRATKITADLLKKVLVAYLRHQRQKSVEKKAQKNQPKQGKVTVKELAKQNAGMVNIEITNKNIKSFERYARKYGINYALKKDKSKEPPVYLVFFKGQMCIRDRSGGYELVAGHRRKRACELAGLEKMPFIIKDITDDEATVIMVRCV